VRRATEKLQELMASLEAKYPGERERSLLASVELSLCRLPAGTRRKIRPLGVFQGGGSLAVLPQLRWLRNFFEPVLRLPNPADKRAVFCFHHAVAAAGFQHSEKPM